MKEHTFARDPPHTLCCIKFGTDELPTGVIHLSSVGSQVVSQKTSCFLGFYGEVFLETMIKLQKTLTTHLFVTRDCKVLSLHVHVVWTFIIYLQGEVGII